MLTDSITWRQRGKGTKHLFVCETPPKPRAKHQYRKPRRAKSTTSASPIRTIRNEPLTALRPSVFTRQSPRRPKLSCSHTVYYFSHDRYPILLFYQFRNRHGVRSPLPAPLFAYDSLRVWRLRVIPAPPKTSKLFLARRSLYSADLGRNGGNIICRLVSCQMPSAVHEHPCSPAPTGRYEKSY